MCHVCVCDGKHRQPETERRRRVEFNFLMLRETYTPETYFSSALQSDTRARDAGGVGGDDVHSTRLDKEKRRDTSSKLLGRRRVVSDWKRHAAQLR